MNFSVLYMLFFGFSAFIIALLILIKRRDTIGKRWFLFNLAVTGYAIGYGFTFNNSLTSNQALFAARLGNASASLIPGLWLYFICSFLDIRRKKLFRLIWPTSILLFLTGFTKFAIPHVSSAKGILYQPEAGPTLHLQTLNFVCLISYGFYLMIRFYRNEKSLDRKKEVLSLIVATAFGFIGGASQFSVIYFRNKGFDLSVLFVVYPFVMAYVMMQHRVLDIETIAHAFQREKLAAIGLIAASANHEIKNPLYAAREILNVYIEDLKEGAQSKDPVIVAEKIKFQINRALEVITKLNHFAKPSMDPPVSNQRASIQDAMQTVLDLISYEFSLEKIKIVNQIASDLPQIQADQRQLEEILFNLIVNACHAMEKGGTLALSAGRSHSSEGKVQVLIQDTGAGISPDQSKHLFEPFHTTKGEKGTGLGLYITKQLVERNGGKISVSSKPNQGTLFILEFKTA